MAIIERNIYKRLKKAITRSPVILLLGARQTGKTTLVKEISRQNGYQYISFDDVRFLDMALQDPMGFIASLSYPVIFDEVQRVPELFLAIKHDVDQNRHAGRYILTGSANPLLIPRLGDSLAERMEILTLYPFSQGELLHRTESFIDTIWHENSLMKIPCLPFSQEELYGQVIKGGFPVVQTASWEDSQVWFENYVTTVLRKDIFDLTHIEGIASIPRLLQILAGHTGSLVNISNMSQQSGIPLSTLKRYLVLLETLFVIFNQCAWHTNVIRKTIKAPKSYLIDTGLLAWLLSINAQKVRQHHYLGNIVENFVLNELKKQETWNSTRVNFFHFRTSTRMEVDIILERSDGKIIGIEVKASSHVGPADAKGLLYLKEHAQKKWHRGIILYTGNSIIPVSDTIIALPISALWSF